MNVPSPTPAIKPTGGTVILPTDAQLEPEPLGAASIAAWRAAAESAFNTDAEILRKGAAELLELVDRFHADHEDVTDETVDEGILEDTKGFRYNLALFVGYIGSQIIPHPDEIVTPSEVRAHG